MGRGAHRAHLPPNLSDSQTSFTDRPQSPRRMKTAFPASHDIPEKTSTTTQGTRMDAEALERNSRIDDNFLFWHIDPFFR